MAVIAAFVPRPPPYSMQTGCHVLMSPANRRHSSRFAHSLTHSLSLCVPRVFTIKALRVPLPSSVPYPFFFAAFNSVLDRRHLRIIVVAKIMTWRHIYFGLLRPKVPKFYVQPSRFNTNSRRVFLTFEWAGSEQLLQLLFYNHVPLHRLLSNCLPHLIWVL